ncbi:hypothetical protein [Paractinoplanes hotanensis]|uniref:Uncharacterized protein n=1 Tax=Paractinoplanes hotanensis TaxID=2906497 RepID=A0ABT0Y878_9ACTN|nr:hypothetical protein [Actinoplanes hotanensis]MCM4082253.1 hypothetical protein [Actinoplanes hotanensis]
MTLYSALESHGRHQLLATYLSGDRLVTSTVTRLQEGEKASELVDVLNRVVDAARAPLTAMSEWLERDGPYPEGHVEALLDPTRRSELLTTGHSLWYAYATAELFYALADLDEAVATIPSAIRTAVLQEVREVGVNLRKSSGGRGIRSIFGPRPLGRYSTELNPAGRNSFQQALGGYQHVPLAELAAAMRSMVAAMRLTRNQHVHIDMPFWALVVENGDYANCILEVSPAPSASSTWRITIRRWVDVGKVDPDLDWVLDCELPQTPPLTEIIQLLDLAVDPAVINGWSETQVGFALAGTSFLVTERSVG